MKCNALQSLTRLDLRHNEISPIGYIATLFPVRLISPQVYEICWGVAFRKPGEEKHLAWFAQRQLPDFDRSNLSVDGRTVYIEALTQEPQLISQSGIVTLFPWVFPCSQHRLPNPPAPLMRSRSRLETYILSAIISVAQRFATRDKGEIFPNYFPCPPILTIFIESYLLV